MKERIEVKYDVEMVIRAYEFALYKHRNCIRKESKDSYITHPFRVSEYIKLFKKSKNKNLLIIASVLHDTVEDTETNLEEIESIFGTPVRNIVEELTSDKVLCKQMGKAKYLKEKLLNMTSYALDIKLCDRLDNISDLKEEETQEEFRNRYLLETLEIIDYLIANRNLTQTQKRIIFEIYKRLLEKYYQENSIYLIALDKAKDNTNYLLTKNMIK